LLEDLFESADRIDCSISGLVFKRLGYVVFLSTN
jgi:hypothetical protein